METEARVLVNLLNSRGGWAGHQRWMDSSLLRVRPKVVAEWLFARPLTVVLFELIKRREVERTRDSRDQVEVGAITGGEMCLSEDAERVPHQQTHVNKHRTAR